MEALSWIAKRLHGLAYHRTAPPQEQLWLWGEGNINVHPLWHWVAVDESGTTTWEWRQVQ